VKHALWINLRLIKNYTLYGKGTNIFAQNRALIYFLQYGLVVQIVLPTLFPWNYVCWLLRKFLSLATILL